MRFAPALLLVVSGVTMAAQQPSPNYRWERVTPDSTSPSASTTVVSTVAHQHAVELVGLMGVRQRLLEHVDETMGKAKAFVLSSNPKANPRFVAEWSRRMRAHFNTDDYVAVYARVYENHFSNAELVQMIKVQSQPRDGKTPPLPPEMQAKVSRDSIAIESEIIGGCSQVGAREGGEIAKQIAREHPEWATTAAPGATAQP